MKRSLTLYAHSWTGTWQAEILCRYRACRWWTVQEHMPGPVESPHVQHLDVALPEEALAVLTLQRKEDHLVFAWTPVEKGWRQERSPWSRLSQSDLPMDLTMKTQWAIAQLGHAKKKA